MAIEAFSPGQSKAKSAVVCEFTAIAIGFAHRMLGPDRDDLDLPDGPWV